MPDRSPAKSVAGPKVAGKVVVKLPAPPTKGGLNGNQTSQAAAAVRPVSAKAPVAPVAAKPGKVAAIKASPVGVSSAKPSAMKPVGVKAGSAKSLSSRGADGIRFPENRPVPLAPVPTEGRPRKNQAGISSKDLENYRVLLLAKRRELVGDMSAMEREALRSTAAAGNLSNLPIHMADMGTDNYEQEFTLGLVEKDRVLLREINQALAKIQDGTYGICEGTGKPIGRPRLEAQPWARYSIEYARLMERGGIRK